MMISKIFSVFFIAQICVFPALLAEDYFRKFAGPIPVKVHYTSGLAVKPMELLGVDPQKELFLPKLRREEGLSWNSGILIVKTSENLNFSGQGQRKPTYNILPMSNTTQEFWKH